MTDMILLPSFNFISLEIQKLRSFTSPTQSLRAEKQPRPDKFKLIIVTVILEH